MYNSLGLDKLDVLKDHTDPTVIVDSLNLSGPGSDFKSVISEHILRTKFMTSSCEISLDKWHRMPFDDKSTWFR